MATRTEKIVIGSAELADQEPAARIDTRGEVCPFPSFETAKLAQATPRNEVIEVISDDKYVALNSIPTVLSLRKFEFAVAEIQEGIWSIKARRTLG